MNWVTQKLKFNSLQKRIAVTFTVLIFVQILLYAVITYWHDMKSISNQVSEANLLTLDEMKNRLETEMKILERVSFQLSKSSQLQQLLLETRGYNRNVQLPESELKEDVRNMFNFTAQSWPEISNIYMHNLLGNTFGHSKTEIAIPIPKIEDIDRKDQTYIDYGIPMNKPYSTKDTVVSYFRLVHEDHTGQAIGWVRLDLILDDIGLMEELKDDPRIFLVFEPNGKLILSNKSDDVDIVTMAKILNIQETRGSIYYQDDLINHTKSDSTGWKITSIVPEEVLNEGLVRNKIVSIALVGVSFILSIFASTVLSYRISRPIRNLFLSMKSVEEGNLKTRVDVHSNDEIGQLGKEMNLMMDSIEHLINQVYKTELRYRDTQFKMLVMQINPHFLYNTLEIIDLSSMKGNHKAVSQSIYSLTAMLRYSIKSKQFVQLLDELNHIESYMNIQKIRYPNNFNFRIKIKEDEMNHEVPVFILQPIIENSFKYALFHKKRSHLLIYSEKTSKYLKIHIVDNGVGLNFKDLSSINKKLKQYNENAGMDGNRIGLLNVHYRIRHAYGDDYGLELDSRKNFWFKVTILLPIREGVNDDI